MPFDPTKPAFGSPDSSAEMRGQLNALNARIDGVPGVTGAVVDSVPTVGPGQPAKIVVQ